MSPDGNLDKWLSLPSNSHHQGSNGGGSASISQHQSLKRSENSSRRNDKLAAVARDTLQALPDVILTVPGAFRPYEAERIYLETLAPLTPNECPRRSPSRTHIHVVNGDSFNIAARVGITSPTDGGKVAVLNMANHKTPGGGWLKGSTAQEEQLCYRSSLFLSLDSQKYPWEKQRMGLYSRDVMIFRSDQASGFSFYDPKQQNYQFVSILSIAAIFMPRLRKIQENTLDGVRERTVFARDGDRNLTKDKMRLCLRMAARKGHRSLILGALGCGAFKNPPEEVARCWLEVLREQEFQGGWWDGIWFAVYDSRAEGNFNIFERVLDGEVV